MSSIFLPLIPPCSFFQATASCTPCAYCLPTSDVGPVRSTSNPTRSVVCASAGVAALATTSAPSPRPQPRLVHRIMSTSCASPGALSVEGLVRERPQFPIAPDRVPPCSQPVGLEDQEQDDQQPEDALANGRQQAHHAGIAAAQRGCPHAERLGHEGHED